MAILSFIERVYIRG